MPDLYRVTFAFAGKEHGWSETLIFPFDNQTPGGVASLMNNVAAKRAEMLGREFAVTAFRVAKFRLANGNPVSRNVFLSQVDFQPSDQTAANAADAPDTCVIYNAFDQTGGKKKQGFLGGPPDAICLNGGDLDTSKVGWLTKFNAWDSQVRALGGGWLQNIPLKTNLALTGYVVAASGIVTITTEAGTWGAGPYNPKLQIVRIKGVNGGNSRLNGQQEVLPLTDTTCKTAKPLPMLPFASDGFMATYTYPFPFVAAALEVPVKIGNHKRGRPLFVSPGRHKARARA